MLSGTNPLILTIFHDADDSGQVLKYVPSATLQNLELHHMNFSEEVTLIREEFVQAFNTLQSWSARRQRGGGVVVTGQPGIGVCYSFLLVL